MVAQSKIGKERLDAALVHRGVTSSREQAGRLILAGVVKVNGLRIDKRAHLVGPDAAIDVEGAACPYVSRGGIKLAAAMDTWGLSCHSMIAMDVGASTGGFTDCLLQRGACRVYAVDVGYGQLAWKIRQDPRVRILERTNIRYLSPDSVPDAIQLAVVDVSFISLRLVLPCVIRFLAEEAWVVALIKPQFEVGKGNVGRGGIIRDESQRQSTISNLLRYAGMIGLEQQGILDSPIAGRKGNREALVAWRWRKGESSAESGLGHEPRHVHIAPMRGRARK